MKKAVALLLACIMLTPLNIVHAETYGHDVPYGIEFDMVTGVSMYNVYSMRDLYRLLDLVKITKKQSFFVVPYNVSYTDIEKAVTDFYTENKSLFAHAKDYPPNWMFSKPDPYQVANKGEYVSIKFKWLTWEIDPSSPLGTKTTWNEYDYLTKLETIQALYAELEKCIDNTQYDEIFVLGEGIVTYEEFDENGLDSVFDEIMTLYGVDAAAFVANTYKNTTTKHVIVNLAHPNDEKAAAEKAAEERFMRILANNTLVPITPGMTEEDKLKIVAYSVANVCTTYEITNALHGTTTQLEIMYSLNVGQCMHYAKVFKLLCDIYGIECEIVDGTYNGINHNWNAVKYKGNWYFLDTTSVDLIPYNTKPEYLALNLSDEAAMTERGYVWDKSEHPTCTSEMVEIEKTAEFKPHIPSSAIEYDVIEPYYYRGPMGGTTIYCKITFDPTTGTIYAINTNLGEDSMEKVDGSWVKKETTLIIPDKIDNVKVKRIASHTSDAYTIGKYDHMYIPDSVVLEDFAFMGMNNVPTVKTIHIGDNVVIGYNALPLSGSIESGENVINKGGFGGSIFDDELAYSEAFDSVVVYYSYKNATENLVIDEGYRGILYGNGNNILDREPTKTITIPKDTVYVDPRLNRLNRVFIVDENNPYYKSYNGALYSADMTKLISVPIGTKSIEIPETVTHIGEYAFSYCNALEEIIFPQSVEVFENRAFYHLSNLKTVCFKGAVPESFYPDVCCDFEVVSLFEGDEGLIEFKEDAEGISFTNVPEGATPFAVFYDRYNQMIGIEKGTEIALPIYAKSCRLFIWGDNMQPRAISKKITLE